MNHFYISLSPNVEYTAWYKSIVDVEHFLSEINFKPIPIQHCNQNVENTLKEILSLNQNSENDSGMILLQYPRVLFEGLDLSKFTDYIKVHYKNYKLVALVHDLDSIRYGNFNNENNLTELPMLNQFDYLITVNDAMSALLKKCGATPKMVPLTLFDYNINENEIQKTSLGRPLTIAFAGNLKFEKSPFIYKLNELELNNVDINLYGPWLDKRKFIPSDHIHYKGSFLPDDSLNVIKDDFGLCWDGDSLDRCSGRIGEYLRYTNPHKTSLYLAMGIPIIISKDISTSSFIREAQVGLVIDSLFEMPKLLNSISNEKYNELKENALKISKKLRNGFYICNAVHAIEKDINL